MGVRLPAEYQEVEYIESTRDGQYIDTLESVTNDIVVRAKFRFLTSYLKNYQSAFGAKGTSFDLQRGGSSTTAFSVATFGTSVRVNVNYNIYQADTIAERSINSVTINGVTEALSVGQETPSGTIWLFGKESANKSTIDVAAGTRIYSVEILSGNIVLKHFIPCYRKSDREPGMYDLVTKQFFTNAGTGEFLVGPDVIDSISPLMVAWRRMLMKEPEKWTYILRADSSGRVPKAKIPVLSGQRIYMEWDYTVDTSNQYVFSLKTQVSNKEFVAMGLEGYPLIGVPWNQSIFKTGHFDAVMPKDVTVYIGCWTESEYTGTTNRGLYGQYIKIRIT